MSVRPYEITRRDMARQQRMGGVGWDAV